MTGTATATEPVTGTSYQLGKVNYDAYCVAIGNQLSGTGGALPAFESLDVPSQQAWEVGALAVRNQQMETNSQIGIGSH